MRHEQTSTQPSNQPSRQRMTHARWKLHTLLTVYPVGCWAYGKTMKNLGRAEHISQGDTRCEGQTSASYQDSVNSVEVVGKATCAASCPSHETKSTGSWFLLMSILYQSTMFVWDTVYNCIGILGHLIFRSDQPHILAAHCQEAAIELTSSFYSSADLFLEKLDQLFDSPLYEATWHHTQLLDHAVKRHAVKRHSLFLFFFSRG